MLWMTIAHAFSPVQISVSDPNVTEVVLTCPDRTVRTRVVDGLAAFDQDVSKCKVEFVVSAGRIEGPGAYTCAAGTGCSSKGVNHRPVSDSPDRINIVVTDNSANLFELKCGSDFRARAPVTDNAATFDGVTGSSCTLHFKGGPPTKFDNLDPGNTYFCSAIGGIGTCKRR